MQFEVEGKTFIPVVCANDDWSVDTEGTALYPTVTVTVVGVDIVIVAITADYPISTEDVMRGNICYEWPWSSTVLLVPAVRMELACVTCTRPTWLHCVLPAWPVEAFGVGVAIAIVSAPMGRTLTTADPPAWAGGVTESPIWPTPTGKPIDAESLTIRFCADRDACGLPHTLQVVATFWMVSSPDEWPEWTIAFEKPLGLFVAIRFNEWPWPAGLSTIAWSFETDGPVRRCCWLTVVDVEGHPAEFWTKSMVGGSMRNQPKPESCPRQSHPLRDRGVLDSDLAPL